MRYAIISDIHSNLEALESVLKQIENERVDKIFCLGDIVGYGPNPDECVDLVRENCEIILTGNHDYACVEPSELIYFNRFAKQAITWTLNNLSKKNLTFLDVFNCLHTTGRVALNILQLNSLYNKESTKCPQRF